MPIRNNHHLVNVRRDRLNAVPAGYVVGGAPDGRAVLTTAVIGGGGGGPGAAVVGSSGTRQNRFALGNTLAATTSFANTLSIFSVSGVGAASAGFDTNGVLLISAAASGTVAASATSLNMTALGNTAGSSSATTRLITALSISGAGDISVGFTGNTMLISGTAPAASATSMNMTALGNTAGSSSATTRNITAMSISGTGGVSVGFSGNTIIISGETAAGGATSVNMTAIGNTTGSSSATTRILTEMTLSGAGAVSVGYTGNSIIISSPATVASATSMNMTALGNTTGSSSATTKVLTEMSISGMGDISAGFSGGTIIISGTAPVASAATMNVTALGNTTGSSSATTRLITAESISFTGGVSGGWSGNTLIISGATQGAASATSMGLSATGNTTGTTSSMTQAITAETISGAGGVSVGFNAGTFVISGVAAGSAAAPTLSHTIPFALWGGQTSAGTTGSMSLVPIDLPVNLTMNAAMLIGVRNLSNGTIVATTAAAASTTATASASYGQTWSLVFYTRSDATTYTSYTSTTASFGATNSWSMSQTAASISVSSTLSLSWCAGSSTNLTATLSSVFTTNTSSSFGNGINGSSSYNGNMRMDVPAPFNLRPDNYIMGILGSTATATATGATKITVSALGWNINHFMLTGVTAYGSGPGDSVNNSLGWPRGVGFTSAAGATQPASFAINAISVKAAVLPYCELGVL